jgi:hypothetical protein
MGYRLEAVIGSAVVLSAVIGGHGAMALVPLRQGLGLVPMTDGTPGGLPGFWKLPGGFSRLPPSSRGHSRALAFRAATIMTSSRLQDSAGKETPVTGFSRLDASSSPVGLWGGSVSGNH